MQSQDVGGGVWQPDHDHEADKISDIGRKRKGG
jgi:hypothetical protein